MQPFHHDYRIYFEDTDAGRVVYHARYLNFFERARTEWLRACGFEQHELAEDPGVLFAVSRMDVKYLYPARLDDQVRVTLEDLDFGPASLNLNQRMLRVEDEKVLATARVRIACLDAEHFRPQALDKSIRSQLQASSNH